MINRVHGFTLVMVIKSFWLNRTLIWQMTKREVVGRYRGSLLGLLWSFVNPIFMLTVYTFVFSAVFKVRMGQDVESNVDFAIVIFAGLIIYNLFAETITRAPGLILGNISYVKKVVFPLEVLPLVAIGSTLFHTLISVLVLLMFHFIVNHALAYTVIFLPFTIIPLALVTIGLTWFLSSLGVYLRDVSHTVGMFTTGLLFLSPIFYPASVLPEMLRPYLFWNPLTFIVEQTRDVLIWGNMPDWMGLALYSGVGAVVASAGLFWFQKTRKGFADVL